MEQDPASRSEAAPPDSQSAPPLPPDRPFSEPDREPVPPSPDTDTPPPPVGFGEPAVHQLDSDDAPVRTVSSEWTAAEPELHHEPVAVSDTGPAPEMEETPAPASHGLSSDGAAEQIPSSPHVGVETREPGEEPAWEGPIPTFQAPVEPVPQPGGWVTAGELGAEDAAERDEEEHEDQHADSGPNWMMAFVCGWAGAAAVYEAPSVMRASVEGVELTQMDRLLGFWGFGTLGVGLILFAFEALWWGRRRRSGWLTLMMVVATLLTLGGVVCLFLSKYPGSRI